jgi:MFS family permease
LQQSDLFELWLMSGAFFFAMAGVFVFFKAWVLTTGFGTLGGFFTIYMLTAILLRLLLGWVPDRIGLLRVVGPSLLCFATGMALLGGASQLWQVVFAAVLCGIGHGFGFPVLLSLVTERARPAERGTAIAIFAAIDECAVLLAGPALGLTAQALGYRGMFLAAGGVLAVAVLVFAGHIGFNRDRR